MKRRILQIGLSLCRYTHQAVLLDVLVQIPMNQCQSHQRFPKQLVFVFPKSKILQQIVPVIPNAIDSLSNEKVHQMIHPQFTLQVHNGFQHGHQFIGHFLLGLGMRTVITHLIAIPLLKMLTKIMQQQLAPAMTALSKCRRFRNQQTPYLLLRHRLVLHKLLQFFNVRWVIKQQTIALQTIATAPARLLIIPLQTLRHIVVNHKPNIWLIDPHAKCNGSYNHIAILHQKRILVLTPHFRI